MLIRVLALALLVPLLGCGTALRVPLRPFYVQAEAPQGAVDVQLDVAYRTDPGADFAKHRLDLYLPRTEGWPLLAFVHGGSLEQGDSAQRIAGNDIYRNIGRFYAARGVGVALINYRLQPRVAWPEQVDDVASATSWLLNHAPGLGGDGRVFLSGHSAGSWLATRVALDDELRRRHGFDSSEVAGVISISGSGFDLTDELTWEMFGREKLWRQRFSLGPEDLDWKRRASIVPLIDGEDPPFLLLYSSREWRALERQNQLFCEALATANVECEIEKIEGHGHRRMLLALSHGKRQLARRVLDRLVEER